MYILSGSRKRSGNGTLSDGDVHPFVCLSVCLSVCFKSPVTTACVVCAANLSHGSLATDVRGLRTVNLWTVIRRHCLFDPPTHTHDGFTPKGY